MKLPVPPQTIISLPVHTAVCNVRPVGALVVLVAIQALVLGLYRPPELTSLVLFPSTGTNPSLCTPPEPLPAWGPIWVAALPAGGVISWFRWPPISPPGTFFPRRW